MFVTRGPVDPESAMFAGRDAELTRMAAWLPTTHCVGAVLGARQTGKTSLLLRLRHMLGGKYAFVFVDFEVIAQATLAECLQHMARELVGQLTGRIDRFDAPEIEDQADFLALLEKCSRAAPGVRIVLLLDEIGALLPDTAFKLSSIIRAVFTMRIVKPEFARYVFVLAGATDMLEVATGRSSPLSNVADSLYLGDLSAVETEQLVDRGLGEMPAPTLRQALRALHDWTAGHPYWTQLVGHALRHEAPDASLKTVIEQLLLTEDRNLPHVFRALEADDGLWELVGAVLDSAPIAFSRANRSIAKLELIGLLKNERGQCRIRNRIYREALEGHPLRRARVPGRDLQRLMQRLHDATALDTLLPLVTLHLQEALQNRSVVTFSKTDGEGGFGIASSVGFSGDPSLRLDSNSAVARLDSCPADAHHPSLSPADVGLLETLGVELIVPIRLKKETVALAWLGRKLSGIGYDAQDHEYLRAVAEQAADAFERIRLRELERDMEEAWKIQKRLLPASLPQLPGLRVVGSLQPARIVAGDYYDVLQLGEHSLALCIGDVAGKGMPAALLMASLHLCVRSAATEELAPARLCEQLNRLIGHSTDDSKYITFCYALVDNKARTLRCTNAGHNQPMLFRKDGSVVRLDQGGTPLGLLPDCHYQEQELELAPGDRLLLFTDGVTESCDRAGEEFGNDRLMALGRKAADADRLHRNVVEAVKAFSPTAPQDDITVVVLGVDP